MTRAWGTPRTDRPAGSPVVGRADDRAEREAEREAESDTARADEDRPTPRGGLPRTAPSSLPVSSDANPTGLPAAPESVTRALAGASSPLDASTRSSSGRRLGYDFSRVRLHAGSAAAAAARDLGALAFTLGDQVVLGPRADRRVLAHELAHVARPTPGVVRRYRDPKAFNFGVRDTSTLKESSFNPKTDKETKPWIQQVTVAFSSTQTADGHTFWTGTATATYYANPVKQADLSFSVSGGSKTLGPSDAGDFVVHRIEGVGYNSGSFSGTVDPAEREGPLKRYSKPDSTGARAANMHFAVFYNRGEALHTGPLDVSSHGCVHVDSSSIDTMRQLNYHSVIGLTKVKVSYPKKP